METGKKNAVPIFAALRMPVPPEDGAFFLFFCLRVLFFTLKAVFYWSVVDLQCCVATFFYYYYYFFATSFLTEAFLFSCES